MSTLAASLAAFICCVVLLSSALVSERSFLIFSFVCVKCWTFDVDALNCSFKVVASVVIYSLLGYSKKQATVSIVDFDSCKLACNDSLFFVRLLI